MYGSNKKEVYKYDNKDNNILFDVYLPNGILIKKTINNYENNRISKSQEIEYDSTGKFENLLMTNYKYDAKDQLIEIKEENSSGIYSWTNIQTFTDYDKEGNYHTKNTHSENKTNGQVRNNQTSKFVREIEYYK